MMDETFLPRPAASPSPAAGASNPKALVRDGYDRASHAYRGDEFDDYERSGYAYWLSRFTPGLPDGARVLDLGCGCGIPVSRQLSLRYQVTGVDISPVQISRARQLVPRARFVCGDMAEVGFEPRAFDAAVAFFSLINLPLAEQSIVIERVSRWLEPGGRLLAIVGKYGWTHVEPDFRGVRGVSMYWSHADLATYRNWFRLAGLAIEEEGSEPRNGNPGYAVLIGRTGSGA